MSERSVASNLGTGGESIRQNTLPSSGLPNGVKFAGEESKDKMYEPKHTKKIVRVLTVVAYVFSVSLAGVMLSIYYVFLWNPRDIRRGLQIHATPAPCQAIDHGAKDRAEGTKDVIALPRVQELHNFTMEPPRGPAGNMPTALPIETYILNQARKRTPQYKLPPKLQEFANNSLGDT